MLKDLGDLANAKAAFERALEISEVNFMSDHPSNARNFNNLSSVLNDVGDYAGAKAACERALNILRQFLPEGHPNIKIVEENLRIFEEKMKSS